MEVPDNPKLKPTDAMTVSLWVYPEQQNTDKTKYYIVKRGNKSGWGIRDYHINGKIEFFVRINNSWPTAGVSRPSDWYGHWHHIAARYDGSNVTITLDDISTNSVAANGVITTSDQPLYIGYDWYGHNGASGAGEPFKGYIDEVKIFDKALSDTQIGEIYNNEKAGKNYDGTERICQMCCGTYGGAIIPLEFEGGEVTLKNTYSDPTWTHVDFQHTFSTTPVVFMVIDTDGGDPASVRIKNVTTTGFDASIVEPQGQDGPHIAQNLNYLAINSGIHRIGTHLVEVGTIDTKKVQGRYVPTGNTIGWEHVDTAVPFCDPAVVANIQTLQNVNNPGPPQKPLKPWGTAVVENNDSGIYLAIDMSETNQGTFTSDETIGYMVAESNIQDSFVDDTGNTIYFETIRTDPYFVGWDNGCKKVSFQNNYTQKPVIAGWKDSRLGGDGGWFRRCYLDTDQIGFVIDEDKVHDNERKHIPEKGAIFAFSDTFVVGGGVVKTGIFNAVSSDGGNGCNAIDDWDNNLTTQIVDGNYKLYILAKDANTSLPMEANISKVSLYYFTHGDSTKCSGSSFRIMTICENGCGQTDASGCLEKEVPQSFNQSAVPCVMVHIEGRDINATGSENNESNATDDFAIRPEKFILNGPSGSVKAGSGWTMHMKALDAGGAAARDYNVTSITIEGETVRIDYNETKSGCRRGMLQTIASQGFADGEANVTLQYDEVGSLALRLREVNGSEFAAVDRDDTPLDLRLIEEVNASVGIVPHHFDLNATLFDFDKSERFTYLSYQMPMAADVQMTIEAQNEQNGTTQNFIDGCYADDVTVDFAHSVVTSDRLRKILWIVRDANETDGPRQEDGKNDLLSFTYAKKNFSTENGRVDRNGTTVLTLFFNFDRNASRPVEPFILRIADINVSDADAGSEGYETLEGNATFYYGRIRIDDVATRERSISHRYTVEVYDTNGSDSLISGMKEAALYWWINAKERNATDGNVTHYDVKKGFSLSTSDDTHLSLSNFSEPSEGIVTFDLDYDIDVDRTIRNIVHLDISPWLWYVPEGLGGDYDYSSGSDCTRHPCFEYTLYGQSGAGVRSGEMNGSDFAIPAGNKQRSGIKLFR